MFLKFNLDRARKIIFSVFIAGFLFGGGYYLGAGGYRLRGQNLSGIKIERITPSDKNVDFSLFWRVWDILAAKYFDRSKIIPSEMVYGAIQGMVASLGDPYTVFLKPGENKIVREDLNGSFEGIGIQIGFRAARLTVIAPLPDSPAQKAGIKAGDFIIQITDKEKGIDTATTGISLSSAVAAIRGRAGTKVTLTLMREGSEEPIIVEVERAKLEVPSVTLEFLKEGKVAYIKVVKFSSETDSEWNKVVSQIINRSASAAGRQPPIAGIIIDLRNNPGGYLQAAVDLAGDFIETGKTVVSEERSDGTKKEYKVEKLGKLRQYKVVVLVNEGSASASEILAGALRDQRGVKLVGVKSFGKGTIQEPIEIDGGSGLHVTTARWLTPNGTWVNEKGLEPDVKIKDDESTPQDEVLQKALELLL